MQTATATRPLAVVTGASSGIGYHLARCAAQRGFDLVVAADTALDKAADDLRALGATVDTVACDLATDAGVDQLVALIGGREVQALMANAGHGLGGAFLGLEFSAQRHVLDTNITGTLNLVHLVGRAMLRRPPGHPARILITGSVAGFVPGSFHAVYNGSKAFLDSFAVALANELRDLGITVTCLMPGATDTEFFQRAGLKDTKLANASALMMEPEDVARIGFEAMLQGETDVVAGWRNKLQVAAAKVVPAETSAQLHRRMTGPGG